MDKDLLNLYSDYLISSFSYTTATGLSKAVQGQVSHDQVTRFLSKEALNSKQLWSLVKPVLRKHEQDDGVIIFDDTIQEKAHSKESELICWHYDHCKNRMVKGINILNCVYSAGEAVLPLSFDLFTKPVQFCDIASKKLKRKSSVTKNELLRDNLRMCQQNQVIYRYVLMDSWFGSKENMSFIHKDLGKHFVTALKSNRTIALSEEDKKQGRFTSVKFLDWSEQTPKTAWIKGLSFPVLIHRQVFKNKDGSSGILYLACSDLTCDSTSIETIYQKRWKVEVFHKTLKSNTSLAKSPAKSVLAQSNHIFMSIYAAFQLECLHLTHKLNHFALRAQLYMRALQGAMDELKLLRTA